MLLGLTACGRIGFDDVVVRYAMDNDPQSGIIPASIGSYDGTCAPCPFATTGHLGQGYAFDGSRQITLPIASSGLVGLAPYSVAAWILPQGGGTVFAKPLSATDYTDSAKLFMDSANLLFETASSPTVYDILKAPVDLSSVWHHAAITWDGTTKRLYFDGAMVASGAAMPIDTTYPISIGLDRDNDLPVDSYVGNLDELEFYGRVLGDAEIATLAGM